MFRVSLHIFYSWAQALVFHLHVLDWFPLLRLAISCVSQGVATLCTYCLLCYMVITCSHLQESRSLATHCFVPFLICCCICLISCGHLSILFIGDICVLIYHVRSFADPMQAYVGVPDVLKSVCVWSSSLFLYTYCICLFQAHICGAPSLNLVLPCVMHLPVIILILVWCTYLVQHSHPHVFPWSDSSLIFILCFSTFSDPLTSSVLYIFTSLRNTFLCRKCICHASVSVLSMVIFLFFCLLLFIVFLISHLLNPQGLDALPTCLGDCLIFGYNFIMPFPWLCHLPRICSVLCVWTLFSDIKSLAFWVWACI